MGGKWRKQGARITGAEQVGRKLEGKLHAWDFLPVGQKIKNMERLLHEIGKSPELRSKEHRFLSLAGQEELKGIESLLVERLKAERYSLDDMRRVFEHYGVDLAKAGVRPEDISYPHGTKWNLHKKGGVLLFNSPSLAKWFEKNVQRQNLQPSLTAPGPELVSAINREKAFGLGSMSAYGKFLRHFRRRDVDIDLIQPLVFYKRGMERTMTGEVGKKGTARTLPLANPDLFLFYAQLKRAMEIGAEKVWVANFPKYTIAKHIVKTEKGEKVVPRKEEIVYHKMPYRTIYQRIMQMSGKPEEVDATHSVFVAKKAPKGKA